MNIENVLSILEQRKSMHVNDPTIQNYWDKLTILLSENLYETISFLNLCSEEEIDWLSEVFDDLAFKFQDIRFIECLDELLKKISKSSY